MNYDIQFEQSTLPTGEIEIIAYDWPVEAGFIIIADATDWAPIIHDDYNVGPCMAVKLIDVDLEYQRSDIKLGTDLFNEAQVVARSRGCSLVHDKKRTPAARAWIRSLPQPQYGLEWHLPPSEMKVVPL
jgi:hypothetical protein